jgi:hypothetical protein
MRFTGLTAAVAGFLLSAVPATLAADTVFTKAADGGSLPALGYQLQEPAGFVFANDAAGHRPADLHAVYLKQIYHAASDTRFWSTVDNELSRMRRQFKNGDDRWSAASGFWVYRLPAPERHPVYRYRNGLDYLWSLSDKASFDGYTLDGSAVFYVAKEGAKDLEPMHIFFRP